MKKEVKAIIAVVLAVWILLMGIEIGSIREKKKIAAEQASATTETTAQTTTQAVEPINPNSSGVPATTTTTPAVVESTAPTAAPAADAVDVSTLSKEQIVAKVSESVNKVKGEQNMTAHKTENITVNVTKLSVESLRSVVNGIISSIVGEPVDENITVANGIATFPDGTTKSVKEAIPPSNNATKDFALTADGVVSATASKQGDNTVYTVVLVAESTTVSNPVPTHNSVAIGYLDIVGVLPSTVELTSCDMNYPGSTVSVTVNSAGQVVKLENKMPMTGYGAAKIGFVSGNAEFDGSLDEVWVFTY